ncbi:MAG: (d)CMP kinase [Actinomycetota bacterium]|nr:(d)CMP kinase [Actinomycetota bacterium]
MKAPVIVAIDGPAGAGKSTVARAVAVALGIPHLDTGAMYRALAFKAIQNDLTPADDVQIKDLLATTNITYAGGKVILDGEDVSLRIRMPDVSERASKIATNASVRLWMVSRQRDWAGALGGVVEGRDIATVVFPQTPFKFFLTATLDERAQRTGTDKGKIEERDLTDSERAASPLLVAKGASVIDTTQMTIDEVVAKIVESVRNVMQEQERS